MIAAAMTALAGRSALAANCGGLDPPCGSGRIPCACGDTVVKDYVITSSLDCSGGAYGWGLRIASGVAVTGGAHQIHITGNRTPGSVGILFDGASNSKIQCDPTQCGLIFVGGWVRGVEVQNGSSYNVVDHIWATDNGAGPDTDTGWQSGDYGIDLRNGANGNSIQWNYVTWNHDEGIHVGSNTANNVVTSNTVLDNRHNQIYLTGSNGTNIGNQVLLNLVSSRDPYPTEGGNGALKFNVVQNAFVQNNTIAGGSMLIEAGTSFSTFDLIQLDNVGQGASRVRLDTGAHDNLISNLVVDSPDTHCLDFTSDGTVSLPYGNRVTSSDLHCTGSQREIVSEGKGANLGQNRVCHTMCRDPSGAKRLCVDNGASNDDVSDAKNIITLQSAACP
jgi:parallel beta-helix repeat protein